MRRSASQHNVLDASHETFLLYFISHSVFASGSFCQQYIVIEISRHSPPRILIHRVSPNLVHRLEDLVHGLADGVLERGAVGFEEQVLVDVEPAEADADELEEVGNQGKAVD